MTKNVYHILPLFSLTMLAACGGKAVVETENQRPGAPEVRIGPNDPKTSDDLVAVIVTDAPDPDGDTVTYTYRWFQNGLPRTELGTDTVPAAETSRGDAWEVRVTPNDGASDGPDASAKTTILNTAPTVSVSITPGSPDTDADLTAVVTVEDADGDTTSLSYAWTRDGAPTDVNEPVVEADQTAHGEVWSVRVTATDDTDAGEPADAQVEITNAAPEVLAVDLTPATPSASDDIVATPHAYDLDGDALTYTYTWYVDGAAVASGSSDVLESGSFSKHQRISVEVVPDDGASLGESFTSSDVEVVNSAPTATYADITPATAYEASTLTCSPVGFSDADGDPEGWTYEWVINGRTAGTDATIDGSAFNRDEEVWCLATAYDGEEAGSQVYAGPLVIQNTAPVLASAELSTLAPTASDTLTVNLGAASDADGDTVSYSYQWYVNGAVVSTSSTLTPSRFDAGDTIIVAVRPYDGTDYGAAVTSSTATALNTAPVIRSVSLSPVTVYTDDTITASVSASDADGDTLTYRYTWYVDGVAHSGGSTLRGTAYFDKGQEVYVTVYADDGTDTSADSSSSVVTVQDKPPSTPVVAISPNPPSYGDDLTCDVVTAAVDADGDSVAYTFSWTLDGAAYTDAIDGTTSSTVLSTDVAQNDLWACTVQAEAGGETSTATDAMRVIYTEACDGVDNDGDGSIDEGGVCPCSTYNYGGHAYMICSTATSYTATESYCATYGYHTIKLETSTEESYIASKTTNQYWIGLEEGTTADSFRWYDGSSATYTHWDTSYSQPDAGAGESCVQVRSTGWHDVVCYSTAYTIACESDG